MKKKLIIIMLITIMYMFPNASIAKESDEEGLDKQAKSLGVSSFIGEAEKYSDELDISDIFQSSMKGNIDNNKILKVIFKLLGKDVIEAIKTVSGIIIIVIIHSILKSISENLGNESVSKIAYYIQYILIVTLIMKNFGNIITDIKTAVADLIAFTNTLVPLLTTLMIATGNAVSSSMIEPILLLIITFAGNFMSNVLIPIILVSTALGIVSKISDDVQVDKLSKFMKKGSLWILTTVLTLFISLATLQGNVTSGLDGVTLKAGKSIVSKVIPVVGGILGDAIDTVLGYSNIIKNAVGVVGIITIGCICIKPILNLAALTITYYLGAALCQPIADKKIVGLLEQIAGTFKILLAILFTIAVMIIIGIAIVMKISNSGVMYH